MARGNAAKLFECVDVALVEIALVGLAIAFVIIHALGEADHCGVAIRIVLDPREWHNFVALRGLSGAAVRTCT